MTALVRKLKKLRGRSREELKTRGMQAISALREAHGLSDISRLPSDTELFAMLGATGQRFESPDQLRDHLRSQVEPHFFASFKDLDETCRNFRGRFGKPAEDRIVEKAQKIVDGRFDLLGFKDLGFGRPIDWHFEPVSGKRAPLEHWSKINYLDSETAGDKKITWELNRHQHFLTLGRAYLLTRDESFAEVFVDHITSWMDANPPKLGINWASSLEVSFRAISWLWAIEFFKYSPAFTGDVAVRMLKLLWLHGRHVESYLSTYFSPNTHLTGESLGLFYLGIMLPEFRDATRWSETGRRILLDELDQHVLPDGVYYEQSSYYHRYTTDFYTHFYLLIQRSGEEIPAKLESKLKALLDHLMYITRPDGTSPLFGDDDGGRLLMIDERASNDFRATLSNGAAMFGRGDYKFVAGDLAEETLWLLGSEGLRSYDAIDMREPAMTSKDFRDGGYFVMRDSWARDANYLMIDAGPHGSGRCGYGHAHADALSFELSVNGRSVIVDPGTFTYTGSKEMRDWFRSSAAHNTLTIDGESSSLTDGPFSWSHVAHPSVCDWLSTDRFDFFEGSHDGFTRLQNPVVHTRGVLFLKDAGWIIRDRVEATGEHLASLHFHLAPGMEARVNGDEVVIEIWNTDSTDCTNRNQHAASVDAAQSAYSTARGLLIGERRGSVQMCVMTIRVVGANGAWHSTTGQVSTCYGASSPASVLRFDAQLNGETELLTILRPTDASVGDLDLIDFLKADEFESAKSDRLRQFEKSSINILSTQRIQGS